MILSGLEVHPIARQHPASRSAEFGQWSNPAKWLDVSTDNFGFLGIEKEHTKVAHNRSANELGSIRKTQLMLCQVISLTWFVLTFGRKVYRHRFGNNVARLGTATG
jgi:hypothetical protein